MVIRLPKNLKDYLTNIGYDIVAESQGELHELIQDASEELGYNAESVVKQAIKNELLKGFNEGWKHSF